MSDNVTIFQIEKSATFKIFLPEEHLGDFIMKFGSEFTCFDDEIMEHVLKKVDDYGFVCAKDNPENIEGLCYATVTVDETQIEILHLFISRFCEEKKLGK